MVEYQTFNLRVVGSSLTDHTIYGFVTQLVECLTVY